MQEDIDRSVRREYYIKNKLLAMMGRVSCEAFYRELPDAERECWQTRRTWSRSIRTEQKDV